MSNFGSSMAYSNLTKFNSIEVTSGTILNISNSFSNLPASFMKSGAEIFSDAPDNIQTKEFGAIIYGYGPRKIVMVTDYYTNITYARTIFQNQWLTGVWSKISFS